MADGVWQSGCYFIPVILFTDPHCHSLVMKRVRTQAEKDRDAYNKREKRQEESLVFLQVPVTVRDFINGVRDQLGYPDQRSVITDAVALLQNYKGGRAVLMETKDTAVKMFIGSKDLLMELVEGRPCQTCGSPLTVESTSNIGTALSIVTVCKNGHQNEWNSSTPNKERTHCAADFDLSAATIMAKSTQQKLLDTMEIAGFKRISTTVFNLAQNELIEVAKRYKVFDEALTESKIQLANGDNKPEFEIDTAYHTRINSWTAATTVQDARTKLIAWSELEVTGEGVSSQQLEKIGVGKGLPAVIAKYGGASSVTSDSCGSLLKQVKGIIQPLLDQGTCEQLRDIWHQQKGIYTKWIAFIEAKWGVLPAEFSEPCDKFPKGKRIPNKLSVIQEHAAQRKEMRGLARWMRGHFTFTIDHCNQDAGIAKEIWENAAAHLAGDHAHCKDWAEDQDCSDSIARLRTPRMVEITKNSCKKREWLTISRHTALTALPRTSSPSTPPLRRSLTSGFSSTSKPSNCAMSLWSCHGTR